MDEWAVVIFVVFGFLTGIALYGLSHGFVAQCEAMFPDKKVEQMICVERREKGDSIEDIWQTMGRGKNEL